MTQFEHSPVMLCECIDALAIKPEGVYLDGTAGGAGHSVEIAKRLTSGMLFAMDQDPTAVQVCKERLAGLAAKVIKGNFRDTKHTLTQMGVEKLDGALLDLGVSSHQLDDGSRGFSYNTDAPLDMRMAQHGQSAAQLVNTLARSELADILRMYGEEPYAWQIAGKIVKAREEKDIETTAQLAEIIISALPPAVRRKGKNPARRSFQALRIAVNDEVDALRQGLAEIFEMLEPGGRFAVITFHSIEDRIVKHSFRQWATACNCPPEAPVCTCGGVAKAKLIYKHPLAPSENEQQENRRSRSAKLRVIEKL